jgi:hypothetical protein
MITHGAPGSRLVCAILRRAGGDPNSRGRSTQGPAAITNTKRIRPPAETVETLRGPLRYWWNCVSSERRERISREIPARCRPQVAEAPRSESGSGRGDRALGCRHRHPPSHRAQANARYRLSRSSQARGCKWRHHPAAPARCSYGGCYLPGGDRGRLVQRRGGETLQVQILGQGEGE